MSLAIAVITEATAIRTFVNSSMKFLTFFFCFFFTDFPSFLEYSIPYGAPYVKEIGWFFTDYTPASISHLLCFDDEKGIPNQSECLPRIVCGAGSFMSLSLASR